MSIFKDALNFVGEVTGIASVKGAVTTIAKVIAGDPELENKLQEFELEKLKLEITQNNSIRELFKQEVQSDDKFVRRARPAMVWLVFLIIGTNFVLLPIVNMIGIPFGMEAIVMKFPDLPENVYWLIGSIFGLYTGARSMDKWKKRK